MKDGDRSSSDDEDVGAVQKKVQTAALGPLDALKRSVRLFFSVDMALLSVAFFYIGIEFGFLSGVYSTTVRPK